MKLLLAFSALFLWSCTNKSEHLQRRIVTDSSGCKYVVILGIGDTVFLEKLRDVECK